MKKRNKIIICLCSILVIMASIFSFIPTKADRMQVSADQVETIGWTFQSSDIILPFSIRLANTDTYANDTNVSNFLLDSQANNDVYFAAFNFYFTFNSNNMLNRIQISYRAPSLNGDLFPIYNYLEFPLTTQIQGSASQLLQTYRFDDLNHPYSNIFGSIMANNFIVSSSNIPSIYCGQFIGVKVLRLHSDLHVFSNLEFFDIDGNYVTISIYSRNYLNLPDYSTTYYFQSNSNIADNEYYNQGYQTGKLDGFNNGYSVGESEGYNNGYNSGYNIGFNTGYSEGSEDSNQYTFLNLVSSTIDAPLTYFQSLFNFELLGVNLQGFLMALFTLCVIVTIVKLCLGR